MKEMQFSVVVMTILMCSALTLLMPGRVKRNTVINRSRWLMVGALGLIGMQFLIQYVTQLRAMGVTQAVLVNLTMLLPASALMDLAVLNLQRQGRLSWLEKWGWIAAWLVVTGGLAVAVWTDGHPLEQLSERVRLTEIMMSIVYASMQMYYSILQFRELIRMEAVIENYYDREHKGLTRWMKYAIAVNGLIAIIVPVFVFGTNIMLVIFSLSFFWGIFMMWFSFVRYFTSNAINRVQEAEENANEEMAEVRGMMAETEGLSAETIKHIDLCVERWLTTGAHLKAGITSPMAAGTMNIPRYQLTAWVKASGHSSFTRWITSLRIEEAKRVLKEHHDWTNEAVADHCGFSRTHFQKIFKQETGVSPTDYQAKAGV
jgi:AraC-like DNA-binding protein